MLQETQRSYGTSSASGGNSSTRSGASSTLIGEGILQDELDRHQDGDNGGGMNGNINGNMNGMNGGGESKQEFYVRGGPLMASNGHIHESMNNGRMLPPSSSSSSHHRHASLDNQISNNSQRAREYYTNNSYQNSNSNNNSPAVSQTESQNSKNSRTIPDKTTLIWNSIYIFLTFIVATCLMAMLYISPSYMKRAKLRHSNASSPSTASSSSSSSRNNNKGISINYKNWIAWNMDGYTWDEQEGPQTDRAASTADFVPFSAVDRRDYNVDPSQIVFPELFHPSLRHSGLVSGVNQDGSTTTRSEQDDTDTDDNNSTTTTTTTTTTTKDSGALLKVPMPTGAFWTNLVIQPTADHGISYPVMSYPYGYKWSDLELQVSYPPLRRLVDPISIRDIFNPDLRLSIKETIVRRHVMKFDPLSVTLRFYGDDSDGFSSSSSSKSSSRTTSSSQEDVDDENSPYWESYLVQGSPYITIHYKEVTPILTPLALFMNFVCPRDVHGNYLQQVPNYIPLSQNGGNHLPRGRDAFGVCVMENSSNDKRIILTGVQFLIKSGDQTWLLFASEPITLEYDAEYKRTISSTKPYHGTLRLALIPKDKKNNNQINLATSTGVQRLINHAHTYPIGGSISWSFQEVAASLSSSSYRLGNNQQQNVVQELEQGISGTNSVATLTFSYDTITFNGGMGVNNEDLLMLALPHHKQVLPSKLILDEFDLDYKCIKGEMFPVVGDTWSYDEVLTKVGFDSAASRQKFASLDNDTKQLIIDQLKDDLYRLLPNMNEDVYGYGKQTARLAQMAYLADLLESSQQEQADSIGDDTGTNQGEEGPSLATQASELLYKYLSAYLDSNTQDNLLYDQNFGGIISKNGLLNSHADYGNGWYNDHHFHYGYILYSAAIMAKLNSSFVSDYGLNVDTLLFDVAHSENQDSNDSDSIFFPLARHKSWFDSHSFASGLFPFGDGKSQESSSEAVNCYYGAYLWSLMRWGNDRDERDLVNYARLLLAMEIRGTKTYWHMLPPSEEQKMDSLHNVEVYDPSFEKNHMVGNLGMMDVTIATWFGTEKLYVHMINFMPVTAITRELFSEHYAEEEFTSDMEPIYKNVEMAWRGYTIADEALTNPSQAWLDAQGLSSYELDAGISKSQIMYWICTMQNFTPLPKANNTDSSDGSEGKNSSCGANKKCADLGLTGECCPTIAGIVLGCCNR